MIDPELAALNILRRLARQYCAVELTISECGCHSVELFVGDVKICEEDKSFTVAVENAKLKAEEIERV